jgi:hypothetical protein
LPKLLKINVGTIIEMFPSGKIPLKEVEQRNLFKALQFLKGNI